MSQRLIIRTTGQTGPSGGGGGGGGAASDITFSPTGTIAATNVQAAIAEVATDAATALSTHESDTTNVHGITDTSALETTTGSASKVSTHAALTSGVHGISAFGATLVDDADASTARSTLGLVIGTNVQAQDAELAAIAGLTSAADRLPYFTGSGTASLATFTTAGRNLIDDADAAAQRTTLGLGTIATQAANSVSITGGTVSGIADLAVADGGTGASDAATARTNLGAIAGIRVEDEGTSTVAAATALNFVGSGVTVTDAGSNEATVTISGGGGGDTLSPWSAVALPTAGLVVDSAHHGQAGTSGAYNVASNAYQPVPLPAPLGGKWKVVGIACLVTTQGATGDGLLVGVYSIDRATKTLTLVGSTATIPVEATGTGWKAVTGLNISLPSTGDFVAIAVRPAADSGVYRLQRHDSNGPANNYLNWSTATLTGGYIAAGNYQVTINGASGTLPSSIDLTSATYTYYSFVPQLRFSLEPL